MTNMADYVSLSKQRTFLIGRRHQYYTEGQNLQKMAFFKCKLPAILQYLKGKLKELRLICQKGQGIYRINTMIWQLWEITISK